MKNKEYITYGHFLVKEKFQEVCGNLEFLNKPTGGIWSSPVESEWDWKTWCLSENYNTKNLKKWTKFILKPETKVLTINSKEDYKNALEKYRSEQGLDWVKIAGDYNAFYLTLEGLYSNRNFCNSDPGFCAWDVETLVVFDFDKIIITDDNRIAKRK
jgi:hypothetical protein